MAPTGRVRLGGCGYPKRTAGNGRSGSPRWRTRFSNGIADKRILRLIRKWVNAGVIEDGAWTASEVGATQGASASPLLANVYLHYVLDRWARQWRRRHAQGDMVIVRFADDFVVGFEHQADAQQFLVDLRERFANFGLELHPDKTRLIEFGRNAARARAARGVGKPETFDFLGFTHLCGKTKNGRFWLKRITISKRMRAKLAEIKVSLSQRRHPPVPEQGRWLARQAWCEDISPTLPLKRDGGYVVVMSFTSTIMVRSSTGDGSNPYRA